MIFVNSVPIVNYRSNTYLYSIFDIIAVNAVIVPLAGAIA